MKSIPSFVALTILFTACTSSPQASADWKDWAKDAYDGYSQQTEGGSAGALTTPQIVTGLKEALANGTDRAIRQLGATDGYWANDLLRIAAPSELQTVAKGLRGAGQGHIVDNFELTLNRAAEKAVPEVADIFGNTIRAMTFDDARQILGGGDQAATEFLQRRAGDQLFARIKPLVADATNQTGVTASYKNLLGQAGFMAQFLKIDADSLDRHVTEEALKGLFNVIGTEEQAIRNDPAARTTSILKEVFGRK